jgi:hypothetical protein
LQKCAAHCARLEEGNRNWPPCIRRSVQSDGHCRSKSINYFKKFELNSILQGCKYEIVITKDDGTAEKYPVFNFADSGGVVLGM